MQSLNYGLKMQNLPGKAEICSTLAAICKYRRLTLWRFSYASKTGPNIMLLNPLYGDKSIKIYFAYSKKIYGVNYCGYIAHFCVSVGISPLYFVCVLGVQNWKVKVLWKAGTPLKWIFKTTRIVLFTTNVSVFACQRIYFSKPCIMLYSKHCAVLLIQNVNPWERQ